MKVIKFERVFQYANSKEEIRNSILSAAKEEFLSKGYRQSSIRAIAQRANVTPGNIYAYFENKEDLFSNIVTPTIEQFNKLIFDVSRGEQITKLSIMKMTDTITEVFLQNKVQFFILLEKSKGSVYENLKENVIRLAGERVDQEVLPRLTPVMRDPILGEVIAAALIEGILRIFTVYYDDESNLRKTLKSFMSVLLSGLTKERKEK